MTDGERGYVIDVGFVALWGGLAVATVVLPVVRESVVRALVAGSFLLFAPGYALVAALFVRDGQLSLLERAVFSVGASFALVGLVGVGLAETPALGVRLGTVLPAQSLVVCILLSVAVLRRRERVATERASPGRAFVSRTRRAWANRAAVGGGSRAVRVAIGVAVVAAVAAPVFVTATPLPSEQYTEFYVLGPDGTADGIPETVRPDEDIRLLVGVANHEHRTVAYGLQVQTRGADRQVLVSDRWRLEHADSRETVLALDPPDRDTFEIELLLFYGGDTPEGVVEPRRADRRLSVTVTVGSG
jgi:uncharacterized membrane protein